MDDVFFDLFVCCRSQERITTTKKGSITSVQAIYVPADDLTDPAPATTFSHLDATTVLSRGIAEKGIYPAVDPLDSTSRILDPRVVGDPVPFTRSCAGGVFSVVVGCAAGAAPCDEFVSDRFWWLSGLQVTSTIPWLVLCRRCCRTTRRCRTLLPSLVCTSFPKTTR